MALTLVQGINDLHQPVIVTDAGYGKQRRLPFAPAELGEQHTGLGKFDPGPKYLQRRWAYRSQQVAGVGRQCRQGNGALRTVGLLPIMSATGKDRHHAAFLLLLA